MRRNCKNRHRAAMAIKQPVDQMKIPRPATPRTNSELAGNVRIRARRKRRHFLVPNVHPLDGFLQAYLDGYPVERIADYSVNSLDAGGGESRYQAFCYRRH